ncbi:hypothetical protein GQ54DRAFT_122209 [Martensiomyces pterosporus]|nr:hypothetical protein GQ54DRAFT_122209 [Martensiomyces pterosporus]
MSSDSRANQAAPSTRSAWIEYTSNDGRAYYFNRETKATTWEKPDELKTPQERKSVWKEYAKDGKPYWYNTVTKKSTWTKPEELTKGGNEETPQKSADEEKKEESSNKPVAETVPIATQPAAAAAAAVTPSVVPAMPAPRPEILPPAAPLPPPGVRPGFRQPDFRPPPVPPMAALESMRPPQRVEFRTVEEAEHAFIDMLRSHGVAGDWTWEQTMRAVVNNPTYRALKTLHERKEAFNKYMARVREEEREVRRRQEKKRHEEFFAMLDSLPISEYSRFRKVAHLARDLAAFTNVPTNAERSRLFGEYMDEYVRELKESRRRTRNEKMDEVVEYLSDLRVSARWADVKVRLLEKFPDSLMPVLRTDKSKLMGMDTVVHKSAVKDGESGAVDPEAGLSMLDFMDAFERAMVNAEQRDAEQRQKDKDAVFRRERQNRDRFRELLDEHRPEITPVSTWSELYPLIKSDVRYIEMLGQAGSTPQELFWDEVELLNEEVYRERKRLEATMKDCGFRVHVDTPLSEVQKLAQELGGISSKHVEYIHEQLVIKAVRRKEEEEERQLRHKRRLMDDFKYALYDLEPPLEADSKWEAEKARIVRLPEFHDMDNEQSCRDVFDHVVERQQEKQQQRKRRREAAESRKRSRSPAMDEASHLADRQAKIKIDKAVVENAAAAAAASAGGGSGQRLSADYSSELEEGEMVA